MATLFRVNYLGPTNYKGSRFTVENMRTNKRVTVDYDYSASNGRATAVSTVSGLPLEMLEFVGEDSKYGYYVCPI